MMQSSGCSSRMIRNTDRRVYEVIAARQRDALGETHDARVGEEDGRYSPSSDMYRFVPSPIGAELPESFRTDAPESDEPPQDDDSGVDSAETDPPEPMGLSDVLAYAMRHARDFQNAKEDLYLAALDLTLERHLWTPQFVASIRADFTDFGQITVLDRAMTTVAQVAVAQQLPYGGEVTARVVSTLVRDLTTHTTTGETGSFIMDANIPLFRGAGRVAYESRYRSERQLIYAVRAFESFRRAFLVRIASDYFSLQQTKARIDNAQKNFLSATDSANRTELRFQLGQEIIIEKARVQTNVRQAATDVQNAREFYQSDLDQLKIRIGMPVQQPLDVVSQEDDEESRLLERLLPNVDEAKAIEVALRYRLDLLTAGDRIDDRKRGVEIAKNAILPDLNLSGSVTLDSDPDRPASISYNTDRATWRGMIELSMNDRMAERNAYRESFINLRRAERSYEESADRVRADVRRALRRVAQSQNTRAIQRLNVEVNEERERAAIELFKKDRGTNRDVVEAQNDLQRARNSLATAEAGVRTAILEFRRDTGSLRVGDDGTFMPADTPGG